MTRMKTPLGQDRVDAKTALVTDQLLALASLELEPLRSEWCKQYRTEPPARLSRDLLVRAVAYKLQEAALGGLSAATRRKLAGLTLAPTAECDARVAPALQLKPGAVLMREWQGRHYTVVVLESGFEYAGQRHRTLSAVAQIITGTHWSGPRFFGLARRSTPFETGPGGLNTEMQGASHA